MLDTISVFLNVLRLVLWRMFHVTWECVQFSSVQLFSRVWLFAIPWTAVRQTSLSITNSRRLLKLMSIESVMPSSHPVLCCPLLLSLSIFLSIRVFSNESVLCIRWTNIGVLASGSVLPMNIQDCFLLGWTGWISLQSKGLSRVFSNTTVQKHQFFGTQVNLTVSPVLSLSCTMCVHSALE